MTDAYRYRLVRTVEPRMDDPRSSLGGGEGELLWVMLNPSTADDTVDDPTIRAVKGYTAAHGFTDLLVVNLFAARSTDPRGLLRMDNPMGPQNATVLRDEICSHEHIVFAWGTSWRNLIRTNRERFGAYVFEQDTRISVENMAQAYFRKPLCLGRTKNGCPLHPCRKPASLTLEPF